MSVILHASDLYFGHADPDSIALFYREIERENPDLVILSGDLTHTGNEREFRLAQDFIAQIKAPVFIVPGSHDIPRWHLWQRFIDPMQRYRNFIAPMQDVVHEDKDCFVVGIDTARAALPHWNWSNGMVSQEQIRFVHNQFRHADNEKVRIFVCHHPLVNHGKRSGNTIVWGSTDLLRVLEDQQVDIVLTGHTHQVSALSDGDGRGLVMAGAGPALSSKRGGQGKSYNLLRISPENIGIELVQWTGEAHLIVDSIAIQRAKSEQSEPSPAELGWNP